MYSIVSTKVLFRWICEGLSVLQTSSRQNVGYG